MKILITYLTGLGNTILFIPALRALRRQFPDTMVDIVVRHHASKDILERIKCSRNVYVFNPAVQKRFTQKIRFFHTLWKERYDANITAFPANRMEFNIMSFLIGAKRRIAMRYQVGHYETLGFLQTEFVDAPENCHDIDQNLSLLTPLGVNKLLHTKQELDWDVSEEEMAWVEEFLQQQQITSQDLLIGFHPGCNPAQRNILKRWSPYNFAMLGNILIEKFGAKILLFGGKTEADLKEHIRSLMKYPPIIPENMPILNVAALIKRCHLFVSNDSGLMHVAAVMETPTVSLFGPSDPRRNAPVGESHIIIKAKLPCMPCNRYPHYQYGGSYVRCIYKGNRKGYCMQSISVESVYETIRQHYTSLLCKTE